MKLLGMDASLTSTGVCIYNPATGPVIRWNTFTLKTKLKGTERLLYIRNELKNICEDIGYVFLEGYSFGSKGNALYQIGELGGVIRVMLYEMGIPLLVVSPKELKQFATEKGNATKELMAAWAQKRWNVIFPTNDETDAYALVKLGQAYLGLDTELTAVQKKVVEGLRGRGNENSPNRCR